MISWDDLVKNVCEQNSITPDKLTDENIQEMKELFEKNGGVFKEEEKPSGTMNGFEMMAKSQGVSVEQIQHDVKEEDDLRQLERNNRLRKARALAEQYKTVDRVKQEVDEDDLSDVKVNEDAMWQDIADRDHAMDFLFPETNKSVVLAPGCVSLFCAPTNNGKSTLCAALAESVIANGGRVLVLANEEAETDVRARVSCIRTGISFIGFKNKNGIPMEQRIEIIDDCKAISDKLVVATNGIEVGAYRTCNKDGIASTLEKTAGKFDLVILDYWQRVVKTDANPEANWEAQRALAPELDRLKKRVGCPIVVFAQIHPQQNNKKSNADDDRAKGFEQAHPYYRWKGSTEILFTATEIVEFIRDKDNSCTHFYAHKVRFMPEDWAQYFVLGFDKRQGKYTSYTTEFKVDELVGEEVEEENADE